MLDLDSPSSRTSRSPRNATYAASNIFESFRNSRHEGNNGAPAGEERTDTAAALRGKNTSEEYMRQMPRRFNMGDLYAPHDLSPTEMKKWRKITTVDRDLVDLLGIRPLDMYRVSSWFSSSIRPVIL
jgi:small subunit ribosomal protein S18